MSVRHNGEPRAAAQKFPRGWQPAPPTCLSPTLAASRSPPVSPTEFQGPDRFNLPHQPATLAAACFPDASTTPKVPDSFAACTTDPPLLVPRALVFLVMFPVRPGSKFRVVPSSCNLWYQPTCLELVLDLDRYQFA
ncbi:hypothetical protein FIBSPDRAFT_277498 [Athelia psychrophila]|uniref:Uncharacterized protein n=1 Tax=Athelia psychrophila TaxID=1759441 RepID=A0A165WPT1_9AGAM|nr:hypothetical protein FIBSPDRAFT_277498 [Fibularhizoctonia sp. CBS 109695]